MSKADQKQQQAALNQDINQTQQKSSQIQGQLGGVLEGAKSTANSLLPGVTAGYSDIISSGGFDPSILGDVRNMYQTYAKTGGVSDTDAAAMRNQAFRSAEGVYNTEADRARRAGAATGNYGYSGALAGSLARQGSSAGARAVTDSNAEIARLRQSGMLAGAQGLTGLETAQAQNRLQALSGASNIYGMNMQEVDNTLNNIIREYQTTGQLTEENRKLLTDLANRPGVFDKVIGTISQLGGAAAGIIGAMNPAKPKPPYSGGKSDIRVKKNISVLGWIRKIPLVIFEFIDEPGFKIGTIAQNVKQVWPDLVFSVDGILHVNYAGLYERLK